MGWKEPLRKALGAEPSVVYSLNLSFVGEDFLADKGNANVTMSISGFRGRSYCARQRLFLWQQLLWKEPLRKALGAEPSVVYSSNLSFVGEEFLADKDNANVAMSIKDFAVSDESGMISISCCTAAA